MKRRSKDIFTGLGFIALFLGCQFFVAGIFAYGTIIVGIVRLVVSGGKISYDVDDYTSRIMELTVPMTLVSGLLALFVLIIIALAKDKRPMVEIGLVKTQKAFIPLCFALGVGLNIAVSMILNFIPFPQTWVEQYAQSSSAFNNNELGMYLAAVVLVGPLTEEVIFRGLAYRYFKRTMPMYAAMALSAVIFGVCHGDLLWMTYTVPLGFLLCLMYERCRSLWASVLLHTGFNFGSIIFTYLPETMPDWGIIVLCCAGAALVSVSLVLIIKKIKYLPPQQVCSPVQAAFTGSAPQLEKN